MKIHRSLRHPVLALVLGLLGLAASRASAQTVITFAPYNIGASGKYVLGGNLSYGTVGAPTITINAPNVILDLNGFFVAGPGDASAGGTNNSVILVGNFANVTIKNGTVAGNAYGIRYLASNPTTTSRNYVVEKVTFTRCYLGGLYWGASAAPGSIVKDCSFSTIGNSTYAVDTYPSAIYTLGGIRMQRNNIGDVTPTGSGYSFGVNGYNGDFTIGNTIANCNYGITGGKYLNNLTYNVVTPFQGGVSATGNN